MNTATPPLIDDVCLMLQDSIADVYATSFQMDVRPVALNDFRGGNEMLVAGSIGFVGEANGMVYIYVRAQFARALTVHMLQMSDAEIDGDEMVNDVVGEMSNMIVGSIKSRLCDAGNNCKLTIPTVMRGINLRAEPVGASDCRLLNFMSGGENILIELLMKASA